MNKTFTVPEGFGHHTVFQPGQHGIQWLGLQVLRLRSGEQWRGALAGQEALLDLLGGRASIQVKAEDTFSWEGLGGRQDTLAGTGFAVYAPPGSEIVVEAEGDLELAIASSPADPGGQPTLIRPDEVKVVVSGALSWQRDVRLILPPGSPISQRLIVGETLNPPGNWSGIPPHKHDEISEVENFLEEFYYFKSQPADGYGLQLMYKGDEGHGHIVGNEDVTVMLDGYHPTVAAPGTSLCYLWVLAGESKDYDISIDSRFEWVKAAEAEAAKAGG
jgi:5-deoxy-glucuronate isomerase